MRNIKLIIEFDGTNYVGWQRQKNATSIQQTLEEAISKITSEKISLTGSSRTDAGVHAKGFVCNFNTESAIPERLFKNAINSKLPKDIVILKSEEVDQNFHARYDCLGKTYCYTILNCEQPSALERLYVYHFKNFLDINLMREGAKHFLGTKDFAAFKNTGSSVKTTIRTITQLELHQFGDKIKIYVSADGFLYNMVRIIVGTLIDVGLNKIKPNEIETIINSKDRRLAGKSVAACGLCLEKVFYS